MFCVHSDVCTKIAEGLERLQTPSLSSAPPVEVWSPSENPRTERHVLAPDSVNSLPSEWVKVKWSVSLEKLTLRLVLLREEVSCVTRDWAE
jgi:hypothetical protein